MTYELINIKVSSFHVRQRFEGVAVEGVGQRFSGATWFPPPMALAAIFRQDPGLGLHYAEQMGAFIAQEALGIGINWVLAPVVDVNNNPDNPVINVRAFGETTD